MKPAPDVASPRPESPDFPRIVLHPSVPVLNRRDGSIQLGWDPEHALLLRLPAGVDGSALASRLRGLHEGLSFDELAESAAGVGMSRADTATMVAELDAAGLLRGPDPALRKRSIRIHGRGPLADAMWTGLRRLGLALRGARSQRPGLDVSGWRNDIVVITDTLVADPQLVDGLLDHGLAHLQVRIRDGRGVIGPLVIPGRTSCLRCADLTRRDHDAEWPYLAAQLLGRIGHARPTAVAATAALALDQLEVVCGPPSAHRVPVVLDATLELDLESQRIARRPWPRHPECGCAGKTAARWDLLSTE
jgi:bacteriocin biosynthesis cyclodehydratase domain-containing protein